MIYNIIKKFLFKKVIGVRRSGALGDVLMITPVLKRLRQIYPDAKIIVSTDCQNVLKNSPYIDQIERCEKKFLKKIDRLIDLNFAYEKRAHLHVVEAYFQEAFDEKPMDYTLELNVTEKDSFLLAKKIGVLRRPFLVMHQAKSWDNRTWPKSYWDHLTKRCIAGGYDIAIIGQGEDFFYEGEGAFDFRKKLTLQEIKILIEKSEGFISIDSGLFHIAQTTQTPVFGIFTIADPALRITRKENTYPFIPALSCRFCLHKERAPVTFFKCPLQTNGCVKDILPDSIAIKVLDVLKKRSE